MTYFPKLSLVSAPAVEPLSLSETKAYLRIDTSDDDTLITNLMLAARVQAEYFLRRRLITQSWKLSYDEIAPACIHLPYLPAQSVTSVTLYDATGVATVIDSANYYLSAGNEALILSVALQSRRVEIVYVAGYGDAASDVPEPIRQAMLQMVMYLYDGRGNDGKMAEPVRALLEPFRVIGI